jgi:hypothetical protein
VELGGQLHASAILAPEKKAPDIHGCVSGIEKQCKEFLECLTIKFIAWCEI